MTSKPDELREAPADDELELPIAPAWFSKPPAGTLDDGIRLSLLALDQIQDRPGLLNNREKFRCLAEFQI